MPLRVGSSRRGHWQYIMTKIERVRLAEYVARNGKCYVKTFWSQYTNEGGHLGNMCAVGMMILKEFFLDN